MPEEPEPMPDEPEGPLLEEGEPVPEGDELGCVGFESRLVEVEPDVLPKLLGLLLELSLPEGLRDEPETPVSELEEVPDRLLVPVEEPDMPVSELCDDVPERLPELRGEVELLEPVMPDVPLESDIPEELTPSCCAVSESTLPVAFRLLDF